MIHDATVPRGIEPAISTAEREGVCYLSARWTPMDLEALVQRLNTHGRDSLESVSSEDLLTTWCDVVERYKDPDSAERQKLDETLCRLCRLSPAGLQAGLEAVLGGVGSAPARRLSAEADSWTPDHCPSPLLTVTLASNLPALAVQSMLPALLLRCPLVLKSPSSEPLFAPAFVGSLVQTLPSLEPALAAITWKGGDVALETPVFEAADRILAYGDADTLADLTDRAGDKVFSYGPRTSLAVVGSEIDPTEVASGLARDIALFDQRGCLSIQAVFTDGDAIPLARAIGAELDSLAARWPPGVVDPVAAAGVQQIRAEATLRGLTSVELPLASGTVVVEPETRFRPTPGLRSVRIHPVAKLGTLPEVLIDWSGLLQGAALAGEEAWKLRPRLEGLGLTQFAAPGELQTPDASWHNGGVHPFTALTGQPV